MNTTPAGHLRARDALLAFAICTLVTLVAGGRMLPGVLDGGLVNPDSYMRLVRLHDTLQAGHPLDTVFRDGGPGGTSISWSHLIDSLLVLLAQPLRLFLPERDALHAAAAAFGPLGMGAMGVAVAWAAAPLAARATLWLAPLAAGLAQPLVAYSLPGVVHHHLAIAVVVVVLGGLAHRAALAPATPGLGLSLGAWSALGIWLSPETMPFIVGAFGLCWLLWAEVSPAPQRAAIVRQAGFGFLLVLAAAFLADPPVAWPRWAPLVDRMSTLTLALAAATALAAALTWPIDRLAVRGKPRLALACVAAAACLGGWVAAFPSLLKGPEGLLSPEQAAAFFGNIAEMQPVSGLADVLVLLFPGMLGAALAAALALRQRTVSGLAAALGALVIVVLGARHVRFTAYPAALGAVMLPVAVTMASRALAGRGEQAAVLARVALIAIVLLVPNLALLAGADGQATARSRGACNIVAAQALLNGQAGRVVLSDVDNGPELLYFTGVRTVGSLYHGNIDGFMRHRAAWAADDPAPLEAAGVELVLHCAPAAPAVLAGTSLLARLEAGQPPPWLVEIGRSGTPGYVLYEYRP